MTTTTAAPAAGTGASSDSPTDTTGAATAAPKSDGARMLDFLASKRAAGNADASTPQATPPDGKREKQGDSPDSSTGKGDDADDKKVDEKTRTVPLAAFQARIGKLQDNVKAAREEAASEAHEKARYAAATQLLSARIEALEAQLKSGTAYDPRDDELSALKMSQEAEKLAAQLNETREAKLKEAREGFELEIKREAFKAKLSSQIDEAAHAHPLADRDAIIAAMHSRRDLSAAEAAKIVHEREMKRLEALGFAPRQSAQSPPPPTPNGARSPGGSSAPGTFENSARGMMDFLASRRQNS